MKRALPNLADQAWLQNAGLQKLLHAIQQAGAEARVVGGAIRNALLGFAVNDIDIATTLASNEIVRICSRNGFHAIETGLAHGTVTVIVDHKPFEVTTLRRDLVTDGRFAVVEFTDDWREDAMRRDFTINALYCDGDGNLLDFTNGYADILTRKVRFVGSPAKRIKEDHLRILRFFRFHAHYGRGAPSAEGLAACAKARRSIKKLSLERITQEMLKLLSAPKPSATLKLMAQHKVLSSVLPHTEEWRCIDRLPNDPLLRLFVLAKHPTELDAVLRLSNAQKDRLSALAQVAPLTVALTEKERRQILYVIGPLAFQDVALLGHAKSRAKMDDAVWLQLIDLPNQWQRPKFPVTGADLKGIGIVPSPAMGAILRSLEDWWVASDFTETRAALLHRATM